MFPSPRKCILEIWKKHQPKKEKIVIIAELEQNTNLSLPFTHDVDL